MSVRRVFTVGIAVLVGLALVAGPAYAKKKDKTASTTFSQAVTLPEAAAKAVKDAFPNATTGTVKMENEGGLLLYSVSLLEGANENIAIVAYDGTIAEVETPLETKDVPEAVAKAVSGADADATVSRILKAEVRAEVQQVDGIPKLVKCDKPKTAYEGILLKAGQTGRIKVAKEGKVITSIAWENPTPAPAAKAKGGKKKKS